MLPPTIWELHFAEILLAFALDFVLGDPRWMPNLKRVTGWLSKTLGDMIGQRTGRAHPVTGPVIWAALAIAVVVLYMIAYTVLFNIPFLQWTTSVLKIFLLYQCFMAMQLHRQVWAVIKPMSVGDDAGARRELLRIENAPAAGATDPNSFPQAQAIASVGRNAATELLAPLFWAGVAGVPGALVYRVTHALGALARDTEGGGLNSFAVKADTVMAWIPARLLGVMSETFREFRSFRHIAKDAKRHPLPNEGWGEASVAYSIGVRLDGDPNPAGEGLSLPAINETGLVPTTLHVSQALFWFWRITAFAVILICLKSI